MEVRGLLGLSRPLVLVMVLILGLPPALAGAQAAAAPAAAVIQPARQLEISPAKLRTWQEMKAAAALEAAGPPPPPRVKPFRPTMGAAAYKALKATAAQAPQALTASALTRLAPLAPTALTNPLSFDGINSATAGNFRPPDTEGAVGLNHFVEIVNSHLDIYQKASPNNHISGVPLSAFFAYTTKSLFDPRVIFDAVSRRWIMSADAFAESATTQWFFFAVSQTDDPTGAFFIYQVNVSDGNGLADDVGWDFPQVGLDQNAVIFTANFFNNAGAFTGARMFTVAKSLLYNGPSRTITPTKLFTGLTGTLSAPIVLDANPNTYLVASPESGSQVTIYTLTNSAANPPTLSPPAAITVPTFTVSANAPQPGTTALLDTSDARFVNAGTQIGNSLFQVHSISRTTTFGGSKCRFYEFDTVHKTLIQHGDFSRSGTSFDFNASIAANRHKDVFVTWSSTDTNVNAEVRFSGRLHTDPAGVIPSPGSLLPGGSSATFYNIAADPVDSQRWGDYSAVTIDPADPSGATAWIVNEKILTNTTWGTRIGSIRLPVKTALPFVDLLLLDD
jgi:hypothetical protein